uniref:LRRNT domain-containing protein n=1 Tax=Branchiostoma floridae TaxID=7739 RepID=C3Z4S9_BRAFL|eukprot:XP_002596439.1 hypothetical protein BRAFLDRAFT_77150 [Branchiostoma floridae]
MAFHNFLLLVMILWTCRLLDTVICSEHRKCNSTAAYLNCEGLDLANWDVENFEIFQTISRVKKDKISIVYFSRNRLTEVPWNGLSTVPSLYVLYLDHNQVESFSPGTALRHLSKLSSIHLSYNRIKALTEGEFRRPVQDRPLLRVYLDNNPIHCDATVLWLANISLHERSCSHKFIDSFFDIQREWAGREAPADTVRMGYMKDKKEKEEQRSVISGHKIKLKVKKSKKDKEYR